MEKIPVPFCLAGDGRDASGAGQPVPPDDSRWREIPTPRGVSDRILPAIRGEFRIDVREHEGDIIIAADLPGVEKDDVSIQLVNPRVLEIRCERNDEQEQKEEGFYMRERISGSMSRIVALPENITEKEAKASFRNGVLEVTLKKVMPSASTRIVIE